MKRKITSILNINCDEGKFKIGTIDKKNPSVIFIEGGFYILPLGKKENYKNDIDNIRKEVKTAIKNKLNNNQYYKTDFMFFMELGDENIIFNKKTYLSFQIFLKPKTEILYNKNFKDLISNINNKQEWLHMIKNDVEKNGFITHKTKKP